MNPSNTSSRLVRDGEAAEVTASVLMSRPIATIDHNASVRQAVEELARDDIGALVVLHGTSMVGVLSERDVVMHVALGVDLDHLEVGEVMQGDVVTVTGDETIVEAARVMVGAGVRHLPVLVDGGVAGMVSARDVLAALVSSPAGQPA